MRLFTSKCKKALWLFLGLLAGAAVMKTADHFLMQTSQIEGDKDILLKKLRYFKDHKDEYSVVFVGASRTIRQIDVNYFDSLVAKDVPGTKSFNFGAPGLGWTEVLYILSFINDVKPTTLKFLFFEPIPYSKIYAENLATAENLRVHDWKHTKLALINILKSDEHPIYKTHQAYFHILSFLRRVTCTGCSITFVKHRIDSGYSSPTELEENIYSKNGGFVALDDAHGVRRSRNEEFLLTAKSKMPALVADQTSRIRSAEASQDKSNPADAQILALTEIARQSGIEAVMLITPQLYNNHRMEGREEYIEKMSGMKIWAFYDSRKFPEFALPENRWETEHLNKKGARLFTEKLAARFLETYSHR